MQGTFIVKCRSAKLIRDTEVFGKMDPYCKISIGEQIQKTKIQDNVGKNPVWEETFKFKATLGDVVNYAVWDDEGSLKKDVLIGNNSFCISELYVNKKYETDFELFYEKSKKQEKAGEVCLEIEFVPDPVKPVKENVGNEENKENDEEEIVKLQDELEKLWDFIEEEREKNKPAPPQAKKKKDLSGLNNSIAQTRNDIMKANDELERYLKTQSDYLKKFQAFLDEQQEAKKYLEGEHGELSLLSKK